MNPGKVGRTAAALILGLAGGGLFFWLGTPLPWMLGSLAMAALIAIAGLDWSLPEAFSKIARPVIGVFAGSAFTVSVLLSIVGWWPILLFLAPFLVLTTVLGNLFFRRACGLDPTTAYFASTPGGLGELSLLGALYGGNLRTLVVIHAMRVISLVVAVPLAIQFMVPETGPIGAIPRAGANGDLHLVDWLLLTACAVVGSALGRALKIVSGVMLVPMLLSALAHLAGLTEGAPPGWLVALVQVVIGSICGARFAGLGWDEFRSTVVYGATWAAFLLVAALLAALLSATFVDAPLPALLLAFSPGGFPEATIIAYAIGIEVAFVVACHVFRIFFVLGLAPPGFHLLKRMQPGPPSSGS